MSAVNVSFTVPLVAGKARHRTTRAGHVYTPKATADAEAAVWAAYEGESMRKYGRVVRAPAHVPVRVEVTAYDGLPKSRSRRVAFEPYTCKPDIDNILKLVLDGLNPRRGLRTGAWADDAQVTSVAVDKMGRFRGGDRRTEVTIIWEEPDE